MTRTQIKLFFKTYVQAAIALEFKQPQSVYRFQEVLTPAQSSNIKRRMKAAGLAIPVDWN